MRKTSGLIAGMVACFALCQAAGAMPVDKTIAARRITGETDLFSPVHYPPVRRGLPVIIVIKMGAIFIDLNLTISAILLGTVTRRPVYISFDHGYGGHLLKVITRPWPLLKQHLKPRARAR